MMLARISNTGCYYEKGYKIPISVQFNKNVRNTKLCQNVWMCAIKIGASSDCTLCINVSGAFFSSPKASSILKQDKTGLAFKSLLCSMRKVEKSTFPFNLRRILWKQIVHTSSEVLGCGLVLEGCYYMMCKLVEFVSVCYINLLHNFVIFAGYMSVCMFFFRKRDFVCCTSLPNCTKATGQIY